MIETTDAITAPDYVAIAEQLECILHVIRQNEAEKEILSALLKQGREEGEIEDEIINGLGLTITKRRGSYDDGAVSVFKRHELEDAYATKEVLIQDVAREYVESGQVPAEEMEPYKKPDSVFFGLPRSKKKAE